VRNTTSLEYPDTAEFAYYVYYAAPLAKSELFSVQPPVCIVRAALFTSTQMPL